MLNKDEKTLVQAPPIDLFRLFVNKKNLGLYGCFVWPYLRKWRGSPCVARDASGASQRAKSRVSHALKGDMECRDMPFQVLSDDRHVRGGLIAGINKGMESV